jgi:hypothetical protein
MSSHKDPSLWKTTLVKTEKLLLDGLNPRIEGAASSSQGHIRQLLLSTEKIVELANSIVKSGALFAGERIIVIKEGSNYVVLEGNRRTCACQLLLNPALIPSTYRKRFLLINETIRGRILELEADVAPSREAAEAVITRRHTEPGIEPWTPVAKQRRITRLLKSGSTIEDVMDLFDMNRSSVTKILRDHEILQFARDLDIWSKEEKELLDNPRLKTNPFTRFFTLKGAKDTMRMSFDGEGKIQSEIERTRFKDAFGRVARELLLPAMSEEKQRFNTRAKPDEIFKSVFSGRKDLEELLNGKATAKSRKVQLKARADTFFESLRCPIQDNQLITVTKEISSIDHDRFKTAATFLLRALLESTLHWCIQKYKLNALLMREYHEGKLIGTTRQHGEPGLEAIIKFCINHHDEIFVGNARRNLEHWAQTKNLCDLVIHGKWANASVTRLEEAASTIRPFVKNIFEGTALKKDGDSR